MVVDVAILGCGPAGLIAADKAEAMGHHVDIISKKVKSPIAGAQFLHQKIGWYCSTEPDFKVQVKKTGNAQWYAKNVYNDFGAHTSWHKFPVGYLYGWDMKLAYDRLWNMYEYLIQDRVITDAESIDEIISDYDMVLSTLPMRRLCRVPEHFFQQQKIHICHGVSPNLVEGVNDGDYMYYNGSPSMPGYGAQGPLWYRFSQLNKYASWEYADHAWQQLSEPATDWEKYTPLEKPIITNCDCYPEMVRIGRYGEWNKEILTHMVPEKVEHALLQL